MKILVTGANGYLGQGIVKQLLDDGAEVLAVDFNLDFVDERAEKLSVNLFEIENPFEYFKKPDVLLHLAWRDGFVHNSPNHMNDLPKHYSFIENMIKGGLKQVAVLGSMHEISINSSFLPIGEQTLDVHGHQRPRPMRRDDVKYGGKVLLVRRTLYGFRSFTHFCFSRCHLHSFIL